MTEVLVLNIRISSLFEFRAADFVLAGCALYFYPQQ